MAELGRPTIYNPDLHPKIAELAASKGLTNDLISKELGIATSTLHEWRKKYDAFSDALKRGKDKVDDEVEAVLLRKAMGYEDKDAIKIFQHNGNPVIIPYVRKIDPDITSIIFWLKNRRPDKWRDRREFDIVNFDDKAKVIHEIAENFKNKVND